MKKKTFFEEEDFVLNLTSYIINKDFSGKSVYYFLKDKKIKVRKTFKGPVIASFNDEDIIKIEAILLFRNRDFTFKQFKADVMDVILEFEPEFPREELNDIPDVFQYKAYIQDLLLQVSDMVEIVNDFYHKAKQISSRIKLNSIERLN